jgi:hypothetical protein
MDVIISKVSGLPTNEQPPQPLRHPSVQQGRLCLEFYNILYFLGNPSSTTRADDDASFAGGGDGLRAIGCYLLEGKNQDTGSDRKTYVRFSGTTYEDLEVSVVLSYAGRNTITGFKNRAAPLIRVFRIIQVHFFLLLSKYVQMGGSHGVRPLPGSAQRHLDEKYIMFVLYPNRYVAALLHTLTCGEVATRVRTEFATVTPAIINEVGLQLEVFLASFSAVSRGTSTTVMFNSIKPILASNNNAYILQLL